MRAWDDFQKSFKRLQPRAKDIKPAQGDKIKRALKSELSRAWDAEDALRAAVPKAKEAGVTGKKPADFLKDAGFKSAHDAWRAAAKAHKAEIARFKTHCDEAARLRDAIKTDLAKLQKVIKKDKITPPKPMADAIGQAETLIEGLDKTAGLYGSLKFVELFYAAREDRAVEAMVKKEQKKADANGLPKDLDEKGRTKTLAKAGKMAKKIAGLCKAAEAGGRNAAKAQKAVKSQFDALSGLNDACQSAASKAIKQNAKSPEVKPLRKFMKDMAAQTRSTAKMVEALPG